MRPATKPIVVAFAGSTVLILGFAAATDYLGSVSSVLTALATVAVAAFSWGTWRMWEYRRRRDHARAGRLFAQVLRLAGQFEAYAMGLERAIDEDPEKARSYITYLLDRVEQRSEEVATLASDAALSDEEVLATIVAADVAIRQLHLLMTVLSESELPTTNVIESMGRINLKLMAIYRTLDRACEKMPLPDEAPISDKGRFRTLIQDRSYGMLAPEKHGFWQDDEDDN